MVISCVWCVDFDVLIGVVEVGWICVVIDVFLDELLVLFDFLCYF